MNFISYLRPQIQRRSHVSLLLQNSREPNNTIKTNNFYDASDENNCFSKAYATYKVLFDSLLPEITLSRSFAQQPKDSLLTSPLGCVNGLNPLIPREPYSHKKVQFYSRVRTRRWLLERLSLITLLFSRSHSDSFVLVIDADSGMLQKMVTSSNLRTNVCLESYAFSLFCFASQA